MDAEEFQTIPHLPQRQDSLRDQLDDLCRVAVRLGMYDAHHWLSTYLDQRDREKGVITHAR